MTVLVVLQEYERDLLNPISPQEPSGESLFYSEIYAKIKEFARADDTLPKGVWLHQEKISDWRKVFEVCIHALTKKSKDLQIAAWMTQALMHIHGLHGLYEGLETIQKLCTHFWATLHPQIEEDDEGFRCSPLVWLNEKVAPSVRSIPLFFSNETLDRSLPIYYYNLSEIPSNKMSADQARKAKLWTDSAMNSESADIIKQTRTLITSINETLDSLTETVDSHLKTEKVSFYKFREETENIHNALNALAYLKETSNTEPQATSNSGLDSLLNEEDVDEPPQKDGEPLTDTPESDPAPDPTPAPQEPPTTPPPPTVLSRQDIYQQLQSLTQSLQEIDPHSPIGPMVAKILSFSDLSFDELRAHYTKRGALKRIQDILDSMQ